MSLLKVNGVEYVVPLVHNLLILRDMKGPVAHKTAFVKRKQEARHKVWLGETPRRLIWQYWRHSSLKKFEDAFDTASDLMQKQPKRSTTNRKEGKVRQPSN